MSSQNQINLPSHLYTPVASVPSKETISQWIQERVSAGGVESQLDQIFSPTEMKLTNMVMTYNMPVEIDLRALKHTEYPFNVKIVYSKGAHKFQRDTILKNKRKDGVFFNNAIFKCSFGKNKFSLNIGRTGSFTMRIGCTGRVDGLEFCIFMFCSVVHTIFEYAAACIKVYDGDFNLIEALKWPNIHLINASFNMGPKIKSKFPRCFIPDNITKVINKYYSEFCYAETKTSSKSVNVQTYFYPDRYINNVKDGKLEIGERKTNINIWPTGSVTINDAIMPKDMELAYEFILKVFVIHVNEIENI